MLHPFGDLLIPVETGGQSSFQQVLLALTAGNRFNGLRVLLVEDNEINQQIAVELMRAAGIDVDVADNGQIAVNKLLAREDGAYHLVLMDLQMPEMDGHQATLRIRQEHRFNALPIIAMTAHAMVEERQRCIAEGMNDHLSKPIDPALLFQMLARWGEDAVVKKEATHESPHANSPSPTPPQVAFPPALVALQACVPALDITAALRRVAGNQTLYKSLLQKYSSTQGDVLSRIRTTCLQGDVSTAERLAHTLKGVSGNIGAVAVETRASLLEKALRQHLQSTPPSTLPRETPAALSDEIEQHLGLTEQALSPLLAGLARWFDAAAQPPLTPSNPAPRTDEAPTPEQISAAQVQLETLRGMLSDMDGNALDYLETIRTQLAAIVPQSDLAALSRHIEVFDFDQALAVIRGE